MLVFVAAASVAAWISLEGEQQALYFWTLAASLFIYVLLVWVNTKSRGLGEGLLEVASEDRCLLLLIWLILCAMPTGLSVLVSVGAVPAGFLWPFGKGILAGLVALVLPELYRPKGGGRHVVKEEHMGNTRRMTYLKREPGGYVTQKEAYERNRGRGEWERTTRIERLIFKYVLLLIFIMVAWFLIRSAPAAIGLGAVLFLLTIYLFAKR